MVYETNRQKLSTYFYNIVFPKINDYGIDYNKTIHLLMNELNLPKKIVLEFLDSLIQGGKLEETRILNLSEEEIQKRQEEALQIQKEAEAIINKTITGELHG